VLADERIREPAGAHCNRSTADAPQHAELGGLPQLFGIHPMELGSQTAFGFQGDHTLLLFDRLFPVFLKDRDSGVEVGPLRAQRMLPEILSAGWHELSQAA